MSTTPISKITAVLMVDAIEPALPFWQKLGYTKTVDVPGVGGIGFAILTDGSSEIMYQTRRGLADDMPSLANVPQATFLFVEVPDLARVERALAGAPVFMPRRETFYGAIEIGYREPGGHYVTFAQFKR